MSYTSEVRKMMCEAEVKKPCCATSELYGFMLLSGGVKNLSEDCVFSCGEKYLAGRIAFLSKKISGERPEIVERTLKKGNSGLVKEYYDLILDKRIIKKVNMTSFESIQGNSKGEGCCEKALLRGCFTAAGTISSPQSSATYVELYFENRENAEKVSGILSDFGIKSGVSERRKKIVVYIKNFEGICDFLILTGAQKAMLEFQMSKTDREVNNSVNRTLNCDMANIERARESGLREKEIIDGLISCGKIDGMEEQLRMLAELRSAYPLVTLAELGSMLKPPLSKSGVSHRMKKILEYAGHKN